MDAKMCWKTVWRRAKDVRMVTIVARNHQQSNLRSLPKPIHPLHRLPALSAVGTKWVSSFIVCKANQNHWFYYIHLCNINLYVRIFHSIVTRSKQVSSICTTAKALGNTMLTSLTSSEQAGTLNTAAAGAKIQAIIDAINGFSIPDCSD